MPGSFLWSSFVPRALMFWSFSAMNFKTGYLSMEKKSSDKCFWNKVRLEKVDGCKVSFQVGRVSLSDDYPDPVSTFC